MPHEVTITPEQARTLVMDEVLVIYSRLRQGHDVSPGQCLRLEGKVELLLQLQVLELAWLEAWVSEQYLMHFGLGLPQGYWEWQQAEQRFCLPLKMMDAPVYRGKASG